MRAQNNAATDLRTAEVGIRLPAPVHNAGNDSLGKLKDLLGVCEQAAEND